LSQEADELQQCHGHSGLFSGDRFVSGNKEWDNGKGTTKYELVQALKTKNGTILEVEEATAAVDCAQSGIHMPQSANYEQHAKYQTEIQNMDTFASMLQSYLNIEKPTDVSHQLDNDNLPGGHPVGTSCNQLSNEENGFVYDVYVVANDQDLIPIEVDVSQEMGIPYAQDPLKLAVHIQCDPLDERFGDILEGLFDYSNSEELSDQGNPDDDEDSNAEDYYANDYPEDDSSLEEQMRMHYSYCSSDSNGNLDDDSDSVSSEGGTFNNLDQFRTSLALYMNQDSRADDEDMDVSMIETEATPGNWRQWFHSHANGASSSDNED
jgi:hypothetical protein